MRVIGGVIRVKRVCRVLRVMRGMWVLRVMRDVRVMMCVYVCAGASLGCPGQFVSSLSGMLW